MSMILSTGGASKEDMPANYQVIPVVDESLKAILQVEVDTISSCIET